MRLDYGCENLIQYFAWSSSCPFTLLMPLVNLCRAESFQGVPETGPTPLKIISYPERTANTWMMRQVPKPPQQAGPGFLNLGTMDPKAQEPGCA